MNQIYKKIIILMKNYKLKKEFCKIKINQKFKKDYLK